MTSFAAGQLFQQAIQSRIIDVTVVKGFPQFDIAHVPHYRMGFW